VSTQGEGNEKGDERFERGAGQLLRRSADELDAATLSRLNRARQSALAEFDRQRRRPAWLVPGWQPALGVAAVAMLAVALWVGRAPGPATPLPAVPVEAARAVQAVDLEVILADENLELIEDLEFYDWLETDLAAEGGLSPGLSG
jgi:hypothetical protein